MSAIKIDAKELLAIPNIVRRLEGRAEKTLNQAVASIATKIRTTAVELVQRGPKTGKTYGNHQASAPGEAPATDTGSLAGSIKIRKGEEGTWYVVAGVAYASYLEFGTERMEARPFMTPAFVEAIPSLKDEIWKAWQDHKESLSKGE